MKKIISISIVSVLFLFVLIGVFFNISDGADTIYTEYDAEQDVTWHYEIVDGEAVNVGTTGGNARYISKLVFPEVLGKTDDFEGYPVTSIFGGKEVRRDGWTKNDGNILEYSSYNASGNYVYKNYYLKEIVLPDTVKRIERRSFDHLMALEYVNMPASLTYIGDYAFSYCVGLKEIRFDNPNHELLNFSYKAFQDCKTDKLILDNMENWNLNFYGYTKELIIGSSLKRVDGQCFTYPDSVNHVPSNVMYTSSWMYRGAYDVWVDNEIENTNITNYVEVGKAWFHFNNKERVMTRLPEGVKAVNTETGEEFTTLKVPTDSDLTFKLVQAEGYNYEKYTIFVEGYTNYVEGVSNNLERTFEKLNLRFGEEYTLHNITRDKTIYCEAREDKLDLNLRQYIWGVNDDSLTHSRAPVVEQQQDRTIKYKHTKKAIYPQNGDKIRYGIKVFNEGIVDGTANKITEYIPEGLKFDETSSINTQYGWVVSEDGRTATSEYMKNSNISGYVVNDNVSSNEMFIELIVDVGEDGKFDRLTVVAEITESSSEDTDSTAGNFSAPVNRDFMKTEAEASNINSYVQCIEDDMDFESIDQIKDDTRQYPLIVHKIDGYDNQLLNGATFDLLDENKNVLKTDVTANGGNIDFGEVTVSETEKTRYYIRETSTPEGYKNHLKYLVRVDIVPPKQDLINASGLKVELDMHEIDIDTSRYEEIEISTIDELRAIQDNLDKKYVLTQDIDLDGVEWIPLNVENVMIDGKGHKIKNLTINRPSETTKKIGLFAKYSGIIENLTLENVDLKSTKEVESPSEDKEYDEMLAYLEEIYTAQETGDNIPAVGGFIAYSENVILKNCKVTGSVKTEYKNVGGLVGHSKEGTIAVFRDCVNEANVEARKDVEYNEKRSYYSYETYSTINETVESFVSEGRNAGGMIGVTLGPVYVSNSVNKGNVYAGKYNAGGMIGTSEEVEYTLNNIFGQFDNSLDIFVKNEKLNGKYSIKINKVDGTGNNLISGAKFSIYDNKKDLIEGYENIELENGVLEIPKTIETIGTDTFYIKETEAPEGFKILVDAYIKVEIEKAWDSSVQKYNTTITSTILSEEDMENDISKSTNISQTFTGTKINNTDNQNVVLKTNDVTIDENSVNEGTVETGYINAGGFVGRSRCSVEVTDAINRGEIIAYTGNVAGIVGQIDREDMHDVVLLVNNVQNNGKINQRTPEGKVNVEYSYKYAAAGIAGTINCDVEAINVTNNGEVSTEGNHLGGILGVTYSDYVTVLNCTNNGDVKQRESKFNAYGSGGILGQAFSYYKFDDYFSSSPATEYDHSVYKFSNCTNKGDVQGSAGIGGIIGNAYVKDLQFKNCKCEDSTIGGSTKSNYGVAGIAGNIDSEKLEIEDCNLTRVNVLNGNYGTGGIVGYFGHAFKSRTDSGLYVKGCDVKDCLIMHDCYSYGAGGIVANIQESYVSKQRGFKTIIENCNVENTDFISQKSADYVGGIVGNEYSSSTSNNNTITISNCNVKGGEINFSSGDGNATVGGIISKSTGVAANIDNCTVDGTKFTYQGSVNDDRSLGGILGYSSYLDTTITDCSVKNVEFSGIGPKMAGIGGTIGYQSTNCIVSGCSVENLTIKNTARTSSYCQGNSAGLISFIYASYPKISNCTIKDVNIECNQTNGAGAISSVFYGRNIELTNIVADNVNITSTNERGSTGSASNYGGLFAYVHGTDVLVQNCKFKNSSIKIEGAQVGGIIGTANSSNIAILGCDVDNSTIEMIDTGNSARETTAGICGVVVYANTRLEDCSVINGSKIIGRGKETSGMIGHSGSIKQDEQTNKRTVKNCKVENCTITEETTPGIYGCITAMVADTTVEVFDGCSIKNVTMNCQSHNAGGFAVGQGLSNVELKDCSIEGFTLNHKNDSTGDSNYRAIGGIISLSENFTINKSKIKDIEINIENAYMPCYTGGIAGIVNKLNISDDSEISDIDIKTTGTNYLYCTGGLVGLVKNQSILKDLNISNINIDGYGNVGGLFGFNNNIINLDNLDLSNINIQNGNHAGGIIGDAKDITITNTVLTDINIDSKNIAGGLIGRNLTDNISGTTYTAKAVLNNIELKTTEENTNEINGNYVGTLVGECNEISMPEEGEAKIIVNNTKTKAANDLSGLIGIANKINNFRNITLNNCVTEGTRNTSAILGQLNGTEDTSLQNIILNNVKLIGKNNTGAIVAIRPASNGLLTLKDITANNLEIDCSEATGGADVGGLVGMVPRLNLDTVSVNDLKVNQGNGYITGGLVGIISQSTGSELKNINITASEGKTNQIISNITSDSNSLLTGIILGFGAGGIDTSNINISNTYLDGTKGQHAGTFGAVESNSNNSIKGITLDNVTITAKGNNNGASVGGIAGFVRGSVESCTIKNSNVSLMDEQKTKEDSSYRVGGIVGLIDVSGSTTVKIDDCLVENSNINGDRGHVGGIIGFTGNKVMNSTVKNSTITNTGTTYAATGGIVGHGSNYTGKDTYISGAKVIETNITGNNYVGGITGAASCKISDCFVGKAENENIENGQYAMNIKGKDSVGAIIGFAGEIFTESTLMLEMTNNSVDSVSITRNNVTGEQVPAEDKLIGTHNFFSDTYTGDTTRTETLVNNSITNSILVNAE